MDGLAFTKSPEELPGSGEVGSGSVDELWFESVKFVFIELAVSLPQETSKELAKMRDNR
jgi:hypothetical protein